MADILFQMEFEWWFFLIVVLAQMNSYMQYNIVITPLDFYLQNALDLFAFTGFYTLSGSHWIY